MAVKLSSLRVSAEMDASQYLRAAKEMGAASESATRAVKETGQALAAVDAAASKAAPGVASLSRVWITGYGEAAKFEAAVRRVGQAMDRGMDAGRATAALDGIYRKFGQVADASVLARQGFTALAPVVSALNDRYDVMAAAAGRAEAATRRISEAQRAQQQINSITGVWGRGYTVGAAEDSAKAMEAAFAAQEKSAADSLRKIRAQYNPLGEAIRANSERIETYNGLLAQGRITQDEYGQAVAYSNRQFDLTKRSIDGTNVALGKYVTGTGLARHELVNMSRQAQDVFVSLASGQSPMTVLIQQGTQIADIFTSSQGSVTGFFAQTAAAAGRFATSAAGALTGLLAIGAASAAAGYQYAEGQREIERSLMGIGRGSGQTVASINKIAEAAAATSRISVGAAREIASAFAGTGQIDSSLIGTNLVDTMTRGYGVLTGKSQKEAGQELAQALASPTAGAAELEKRLGKLSDAQLEFIRNAEAAGNRLEAQRALLSAINEPLSMASNRVGLFAQAWEAVAKAVGGAADAIGRVVNGPSLDERIAGLQRLIEQRSTFNYRQSSIPQAEAQLAPLLRERRLRNEAAEYAREEARSNSLSQSAGGIARGIATDAGRRMDLENQLSVLEKAFGDQSVMRKLGPTADLVRESIERLRGSLANFETVAERLQRDYELQIQQTNAYTLAEKAAVEAERARIEAIRAGRGEVQAGVEAEQARSKAITEANRQLRDTARDLSDAGSLIGLSPFQRSLREAANASRRERDTLTTGAAPTGPLSRDQILDMIAKYESGNRNIHQNIVPPGGGYNPSVGRVTGPSSAQGYFQITNPTWRDGAKLAGVDLKQFPNAMSAPYDVQRKVAGSLLDSRGTSPWAPYNASLRNALGGQGGAAANDNASARVSNAVREAYEGWNTPLASSERQLTAQIALMEKQQASFFKSAGEIERAAEKQRLLNEYQQQGVPITQELAAGIDAYAQRAGAAAAQAEAFAGIQKAFNDLEGVPRDALKGFISDLRSGKSGAEALANALNRVADKVIDIALNSAFGKSGGGGNWFTSLFGFGGGISGSFNPLDFSRGSTGLFGPGFADGGAFGSSNVIPFARGGAFTNTIVNRPTQFRFANGGALSRGLMGEAGPEAIMPLRRNSMGQLGVMTAGRSSAQQTTAYAPVYNIDARGADAAAVARLERGLAERDRKFSRNVQSVARETEIRGTRG